MSQLRDMPPLQTSRYSDDMEQDGLSCGSLNPFKVAQLKRERENVGSFFNDDDLRYDCNSDFKNCDII